jgi:preflagellin peptidase FlaK
MPIAPTLANVIDLGFALTTAPALRDLGVVLSTAPDLLRLLAIPVFGWAAWRDIKIRRVPNRTWLPLLALGLLTLAWQTVALADVGGFRWQLFVRQVAISLGLVIPLSYAFWRVGGFGGADAKALMVLAVLFPTFPSYYLFGTRAVPLVQTQVGVFSFTILTNAVIVAASYPLALALYNAVRGRFSSVMAVGRERHWSSLPTAHGQLLERPSGLTRRGLDLDALRMYLRWRGLTLAEVRERPGHYRDPATLPEDPNPPTDGAVVPGEQPLVADAEAEPATDGGERSDEERQPDSGDESPADAEYDDPWGAAAFLDSLNGSAYGTTPEDLRDGLDVIADADVVWVSPGIPFIVPLFGGLVVSLLYGDLLFTALQFLGLV